MKEAQHIDQNAIAYQNRVFYIHKQYLKRKCIFALTAWDTCLECNVCGRECVGDMCVKESVQVTWNRYLYARIHKTKSHTQDDTHLHVHTHNAQSTHTTHKAHTQHTKHTHNTQSTHTTHKAHTQHTKHTHNTQSTHTTHKAHTHRHSHTSMVLIALRFDVPAPEDTLITYRTCQRSMHANDSRQKSWSWEVVVYSST